nr:hypothetical protein [Tanacetum cinerariifolium]
MGTKTVIHAGGVEGALQLGLEEDGVFSDLTQEEKDMYKADIRVTNILLQGLPKDIYELINNYTNAKDIWDNVKMLLEGFELTKDDRESQLYDDFKHFHQNKGEKIHSYYVTGLRESNFDQLYAYLKQHEYPAQLSISSQSSHQPSPTDRSQNEAGFTLTDYLIESLTNTLSLLTLSYKAHLPQTNNQLITSSNTKNKATFQDERVVVQDVRGRYNANNQGRQFQRNNARGFVGTGNARTESPILMMMWMIPPGQDLALNMDHVFEADQCDAFDSDVDEAPMTQTMFMVNFSFEDPIYDEAGPSYDSDIPSEVQDHDSCSDRVYEHHDVHEMQNNVQQDYVADFDADYMSDSNIIPYDQYV